jgi:hypothetical protein
LFMPIYIVRESRATRPGDAGFVAITQSWRHIRSHPPMRCGG